MIDCLCFSYILALNSLVQKTMQYLNKFLEFVGFVGNSIICIFKLLLVLLKNIFSPLFTRTKKVPRQSNEKPKKYKILSFFVLLKDTLVSITFWVFRLIRNVIIFPKKLFTFLFLRKSFLSGVLFAIFFIFIPVTVIRWFKELPSPDSLVIEANKKSTVILDRNGKLMYEIYVDKNYNPVNFEDIPEYVKNATLAVEDDKFYNHFGIRIDSVIRAIKNNLTKENSLQGGSTITQQLVKNVLLTPERTFSRKIKEAFLAILVEAKYSKKDIFEMYLNNIPYGGVAWGVQTASRKYFNKDVWELSLAEASLLAGLPTAPTSYSPATNLETAKSRQRFVLERMLNLGYINKEEFNKAVSEELVFADTDGYIRAPHFVDFIRKDLEKRYGRRYVEFGGLTVTTTLDLDIQDKVQSIVTEEVNTNSYLGFSNGASVVMDVKNAEVLAYVGSIDYFKEIWGSYDVVTAMRQPGSSIKPVTYALALSGSFTPASIIDDSPVTYKFKGSEDYTPVNYDGRYHGKVTLRQALANSYNVPAVKIANVVGVDNIVVKGSEMGLTGWKPDGSYGLSITLGGKEVRLLDHTNLYATLARRGIYKEPEVYISIKDSNGYEIYKNENIEKAVVSPEVSYLLWDILSDQNARLPAFGVNNFLSIPGHKVAVKTGTTNNIKDNWTLGYTPSYVVGVWVGNNDGSPMRQGLASGLTGAAPIWNKIMTELLKDKPNEIYEKPANVFIKKDEKCGASELFVKGTVIPGSLCPEKEKGNDKNKEKDREG